MENDRIEPRFYRPEDVCPICKIQWNSGILHIVCRSKMRDQEIEEIVTLRGRVHELEARLRISGELTRSLDDALGKERARVRELEAVLVRIDAELGSSPGGLILKAWIAQAMGVRS